MPEIFLKYKAEVYEDKIGRLDDHIGRLEDLLTQLETKKNEISNFWEGDQATEFETKISEQIERVRTATRTCKGLREQYRQTMEKYERMSGFVGQAVEGLEDIVSRKISGNGSSTPSTQSYL